MIGNKESMNNNLKMLYFFDSPFNSKLQNEYKGKTALEILQDYTEFKKTNRFEYFFNTHLKTLKLFTEDVANYAKNSDNLNLINLMNKNNSLIENTNTTSNLNNITSSKTNNTLQNIAKDMLHNIKLRRGTINVESKISSNINVESKLYNKFPLPVNIIGKQPITQRNSNYIELITNFNTEIAKSKNIMYNFNNNNSKLVKNIYSILEYSFKSMSSIISKPIISVTPDKIIIHLFFFLLSNNRSVFLRNSFNSRKQNFNKLSFLKKNNNKLESLCALLSKIFNKPVELELVRLHYPFYEPNILVNAFGAIVNTMKLRNILNKLFQVAVIKNPTRMINKKRFSLLPCYLSGLSVKIGGRLMTQRVVPRKTVKFIQVGSLARRKALLVENARFTNKNKRGSFSISVSAGYFM